MDVRIKNKSVCPLTIIVAEEIVITVLRVTLFFVTLPVTE